jgi:hypothetical protein
MQPLASPPPQTSFYDQPSAPPETLNLPPLSQQRAADELDGLADVKLGDDDEVGWVWVGRWAGLRVGGWVGWW